MKKLGQDYYMEILIEMKLNIWFNPVKATIPDKNLFIVANENSLEAFILLNFLCP